MIFDTCLFVVRQVLEMFLLQDIVTDHVIPLLDLISLSRLAASCSTYKEQVNRVWRKSPAPVHLVRWTPSIRKAIQRRLVSVKSTDIWNRSLHNQILRGYVSKDINLYLKRYPEYGDDYDVCKVCGTSCKRSLLSFRLEGEFLHGTPYSTEESYDGTYVAIICADCYNDLYSVQGISDGDVITLLGYQFVVDISWCAL